MVVEGEAVSRTGMRTRLVFELDQR